MSDNSLLKLKHDILTAPIEKQKIICWILKTKLNEKVYNIKKKVSFNLGDISKDGIKTIKSILYENKIDMVNI